MKYNFKETYLTEGFFDDLEDDLNIDYSEEVRNTVQDMNDNIILSQIKQKFISIVDNDNINIKIINDINKNRILITMFNPIQPDGKYILDCRDIKLLQEIIDLIARYYSELKFRIHTIHLSPLNVIDVADLDCHGLTLDLIECNDVKIHSINIKNCTIKSGQYISFIRSNFIDNNIKLYGMDIAFNNCNIQDYSFIKRITTKLNIDIRLYDYIQNCYNFSGLPKGEYELFYGLYSYSSLNPERKYTLQNKFTLIGLPDTLSSFVFHITPYDTKDFINNFSFKGINKNLYDKSDIRIKDGDNEQFNVQIGKYTVPSTKNGVFKLTKRALNYMLKTNDYNMTYENKNIQI